MSNASKEIPDADPTQYTVLIDQREQKPFQFLAVQAARGGKLLVVNTQLAHLETGDYSLLGFENRIAVERKSRSDLFHCMGGDRRRFEEQVRRLNELEHGYVMVEAGFDSILMGDPNSKLDGKIVFRTIVSWQQKYPRVHWWLCPQVQLAEGITLRILDTFWRHEQEGFER